MSTELEDEIEEDELEGSEPISPFNDMIVNWGETFPDEPINAYK